MLFVLFHIWQHKLFKTSFLPNCRAAGLYNFMVWTGTLHDQTGLLDRGNNDKSPLSKEKMGARTPSLLFFFSSLYYNLDQNKTAHWSVKLISKPTKIHIPHHSDISSWLLHFLHYEMHESWFVWKRKLSLEELYMLLGVSLDYYVPRISFSFWRFMYIHYVLDRLAKPFCSKSETF